MPKTSFTVKRDELKVVMERVFDAPRDLVWKIVTDPKLIPQWWGPKNLTTKVEKMDVQLGGEWRFIHTDAAGTEYGFHGKYLQVTPSSLISDTFNYEGIPGDHELTETMTLEELDGKTKVTTVSVYKNIEDLDGMVNSGMEGGAVESWERLAELVEQKK